MILDGVRGGAIQGCIINNFYYSGGANSIGIQFLNACEQVHISGCVFTNGSSGGTGITIPNAAHKGLVIMPALYNNVTTRISNSSTSNADGCLILDSGDADGYRIRAREPKLVLGRGAAENILIVFDTDAGDGTFGWSNSNQRYECTGALHTAYGLSHEGILDHGTFEHLPTGATPAVNTGALYKTANASPTTITNFSSGVQGQRIVIVGADSGNTTLDLSANANMKGNSGSDKTLANGDHAECIYDGTVWYCQIFTA